MPSANLNKPPATNFHGSPVSPEIDQVARVGRYGAVGLSGVLVNLGVLWTLTRWSILGNPNVASAIAIECSILWNFWLHDRWTFDDRRSTTARLHERMLRFHTVAAFGAMLQWVTFAGLNYLIACATPFAPQTNHAICEAVGIERWIGAITSPPEVGSKKFLSQLTGIGLATVWNFVMNTRWTFRVENSTAR